MAAKAVAGPETVPCQRKARGQHAMAGRPAWCRNTQAPPDPPHPVRGALALFRLAMQFRTAAEQVDLTTKAERRMLLKLSAKVLKAARAAVRQG